MLHLRFLILYLLLSITIVNAQLSGVYSVPGSFSTIASAVNNLNTYGVSGAVTIQIAAGYTETAVVGGYSVFPIAGTSTANTVTFQKSGTGANPIIFSYNGIYTNAQNSQDGIWRFIGADHITIDGLDLTDNRTSSPGTMEFGFGLFNQSRTNGCQHITIKNCVIKLNRTVVTNSGTGLGVSGATGILALNSLPHILTNTLVINSVSGSHSKNVFSSNLIQDCNFGIALLSRQTYNSFSHADMNNIIGGLNAASGNTIINFGGATVTASHGIYTIGQANISIGHNIINNATGTVAAHPGVMYAIYNQVTVPSSLIAISNNTLTVKTRTINTTQTYHASAIQNLGSELTDSLLINNNSIINCHSTFSSSGHFRTIYNENESKFASFSFNTFSANIFAGPGINNAKIQNVGKVYEEARYENNIVSTDSITSPGFQGYFAGIAHANGTENTIISVKNNIFSKIGVSGTQSSVYLIRVSGDHHQVDYNGNSFTDFTANHVYSINFIDHQGYTAGVFSLSNNTVSTVHCGASSNRMTIFGNTGSAHKACVVTYSGNVISNISSSSGTFCGIYSGEGFSGTHPRKRIYSNHVSNVNISSISELWGIFMDKAGEGTTQAPSEVFSNTITTLSSLRDIAAVRLGNNTSAFNIPEIHHNYIHNIQSQGVTYSICRGIYARPSAAGCKIYNNNVTTINTVTLGTSVGIDCLSDKMIIYNNVIGHINSPNNANPFGVIGIRSYGNISTHTVAYNSIYLSGSSFGSAGIQASTLIRLNNNLVVNTMSATNGGIVTALKLETSGFHPPVYDAYSDHNLYYAGIPGPNNVLLLRDAVTYSTLAVLKAGLGQPDQNAVTENPPFASVTPGASNYLSISSGSATAVESGAAPLPGISQDFYGNMRDPVFPDIGAIEANYTPLFTDNTGPVFGSTGFNSTACNTSGRTFTAVISDIGGVAGGSLSPVAYFKINTGTYTAVQGSLVSGNSISGTWQFPLNYSAVIGNTVTWFVVAQDLSANISSYPPANLIAANVNSVTSISGPGTYTVKTELAGSYTVGSTGTFTSLTQAANAYNNSCLNGPVTFVLTNSLYTNQNFGTELYPITFLEHPDASPTNSLLIVPGAASSPTIYWTPAYFSTNTVSLMQFKGAKYISINGQNNGGQLHLYTNYVTQYHSMLWLSSDNQTHNKYISIENTYIQSTHSSVGNYYMVGINASGTSTFSFTKGYDSDFITIKNNTLTGMTAGIAASGHTNTPVGGNDHWEVSGNTFLNSGAFFENTSITSIHHNTLTGSGLNISFGSNQIDINHNVIRSIYGSGATGVRVQTYDDNSDINIFNNLISDLKAVSFSSNLFVRGIYLTNSGRVKLNFNTIALTGTNSAITSSLTSAALFLNSCSDIESTNNIFFNNISSGSGSRNYAIYSSGTGSFLKKSDYNIYCSIGNQALFAYYSGNAATIAALRSATGGDANSFTVAPVFTSSVDAHIDVNALANYTWQDSGTPVPGITTDVDGEVRNASTPDIGADEFTSVATCTAASGGTFSFSSFSACETQNFTITPNGISYGNGISYQWSISSSATSGFSNVVNGGSQATFNTLGQLPGGTYYLYVEVSCPSASLSSTSNTIALNISAIPSITVTANPGSVCTPTTVTLTATGATNYTWSTNATSPSIAVTSTTSASYNLEYRSGPCPVSSTVIQVFAGTAPSINIIASSNSVCAGSQVTLNATGALSYSWSTGATTSSIVVSPATHTTWSVTAFSSSNCPASASRSVFVMPSPSIAVSGPTMVCTTQPITLTATGAANYTWTGYGSVASITYTPAGTTVFTVTGNNGGVCSSTVEHTLHYSPVLTPTLSAPANICAGDSFTATIEGTQPYLWSGGSTSSVVVFTPSSSTGYTVTTGAGSCTAVESFTVNVFALPATQITGPAQVCAGSSATFLATGASSYTWSNGAITSSIVLTPTSTTQFSLTGKDLNGCVNTATHHLIYQYLPTVTISGPTVSCSGSTLALSATGAQTYTWNTGSTTSVLTVTASSADTFSVTGELAGCISSVSHTLDVLQSPTLSINGYTSICLPDIASTITLAGADSYSINGIGSGTLAVLTQSATSIYTVSAKNLNGCETNSVFTLVSNPQVTLSLSISSYSLCNGNSSTLSVSGASQYSWSTGSTSSLIVVTPSASAVYTVNGSDAGCVSSVTIPITVLARPSISVTPNTVTVCALDPVTFTATGADTYSWTGGYTGQVNTYTPAASAVYTLEGTSIQNNCTGQQTFAITTKTVPVLTVSGATAICSGESATMSVAGALTYTWSNGFQTNIIAVSPLSSSVFSVSGTNAGGCVSMMMHSVTVNALPVLGVLQSTNTVCSGSAVSFTSSGASTYSWSTGSTSNITLVHPLVNTIYTVTGISSHGCQSTATVAVSTLSLPAVAISPASASVCAHNTLALSASGAASYTWSNSYFTSAITITPAVNSIYSVTGSSSNGCRNTATVAVHTFTLPVVSVAGTGTACANDDVVLSASGANTYTWVNQFVGNSFSLSAQASTVISVSGINNEGCVSTTNHSITVNALPLVSVTPGSYTVCANSQITFTAAGAHTYSWSGGSTSSLFSISPLASSVYTVTGFSLEGCTATATSAVHTLSVPVLTVSAISLTSCAFSQNTLSASGAASYSWSTGDLTNVTVTSPSVTTTYSVTGFADNACSSTQTVLITVNPLPAISVSGNSTACSGQTLTLTGSGASNYSWSTGSSANTITLTANLSTVVIVSGTNTQGCSNTKTFSITVNSTPVFSLASSSSTLCAGESITLSVSGNATTYSWTPFGLNSNTVTITPAVSGIYTVTGFNGNCNLQKTGSYTVHPLPVITLSTSANQVCEGETIDLFITGADSYLWSTGDTSKKATVTPLIPTTYTAVGFSKQGCTSAVKSVYVDAMDCLSLVRNEDMDVVNVYPTPSYGTLNVETPLTDYNVKIFDATGRVVFSGNTKNSVLQISTTEYAKGVYTMMLVKSGATHYRKLVIQ